MSGFDAARLGAVMQDLLALVRQRPRNLLPFEEVRDRLKLRRVVDRGTRDVALGQIVGTFGRRGEFNRAFLPRSESLRERWEDVRDLAVGASGFPSVELYQVGNAYFAVDGHHRISVARSLGAPSIEAHVRSLARKRARPPGTEAAGPAKAGAEAPRVSPGCRFRSRPPAAGSAPSALPARAASRRDRR